MSAANYADHLFFSFAQSENFDSMVGAGWQPEENVRGAFQEAMRAAFRHHGYHVGDLLNDVASDNLDYMIEKKAVAKEGDEFTGSYLRLSTAKKDEIARLFLDAHDVSRRIQALGPEALKRALSRLADQEGWRQLDKDDEPAEGSHQVTLAIPASDRLVLLSHNSAGEIERATTAVIEELSRENSIDGDVEARDRFLGQLKASRELVLAHSVRAYLLYETVVRVLSSLIDRYKDHAIAELSRRLLDLLIEEVFKK